jgi:hypothetical protein
VACYNHHVADGALRSKIEICLGVRLRTRWREGRPSAGELSALRRVLPEFTELGMGDLRRRYADGRPFTTEVMKLGGARALSAKARALGLELEVVKELAWIDEDQHTWIADGGDARRRS